LQLRQRRARSTGDAEKYFLRQLARIPVPDDAAQVAEDPVAMRSKENVGVSDHVRSSLKTPQAAEPLTEAEDFVWDDFL